MATVLSLPPELLENIFTLALSSPKASPSLLLVSRRIYVLARTIPPRLYPAQLYYDSNGSGRLYDLLPTHRRPWQLSNLRRLEIRQLHPSQLGAFVGQGSKNGRFEYLFNEPLLNLDILTIRTKGWITHDPAVSWRLLATPEDVRYDIPGPGCRWLEALCAMKGFRQLDLILSGLYLTGDENYSLPGLFDDFRAAMAPENGVPEWTLWHRASDKPVTDEFTVLRTDGLHLHSKPQWTPSDLQTLREGKECVIAGRENWNAGGWPNGPFVDKADGEIVDGWVRKGEGKRRPGFHVGQRLDLRGVCKWCIDKAIVGEGGVRRWVKNRRGGSTWVDTQGCREGIE